MQEVASYLGIMWQNFLHIIRQFTLLDALDVLIVTGLFYGVIKLMRETRAGQLVKGVIFLGVLFLLSYYLDLTMLGAILRAFFQFALIVVVILFQPEIRNALEQIGRNKVGASVKSLVGIKGRSDEETAAIQAGIDAAVDGVGLLQEMRMGALIVFERYTRLGEIAATGTIVEADPTAQLIGNIFFNKAPLHDGAMIIRDGRIYAAGCILPLTANEYIEAELGTRHRAALGMSENSDAVVVVVSEETSQVSLAIGGHLRRDLSRVELKSELERELLSVRDNSNAGGGIFKRLFGKRGEKE